MKQTILVTLALLLPAIPAVIFSLTLMGVGDLPSVLSGDSFRGMNPIAALAWGFGVYFIGLSLLGLGAILFQSFQDRPKRK